MKVKAIRRLAVAGPRLFAVVLVFCVAECLMLNFVVRSGSGNASKRVPLARQPRIAVAGTAGSLDSTFGTGGKVTTDFANNSDQAHDVAFQSDGKIIAGGSAIVNPAQQYDFALTRYNTNGSLDASFGNGGKVTTDFGGDDDIVRIAIQPDGKIVAVGATCLANCVFISGSGYDYALARYNTNGTLDTSFGNGGKVTTDFFGGLDIASCVVIQSDGRIVVGGLSCQDAESLCLATGNVEFSMARYNKDGSLDTTFGSGGKVVSPVLGFSGIHHLALQSDGKIIAAGQSFPGADSDFALARYNVDGTLDMTFGSGGKVITDFSTGAGDHPDDLIMSVAIQKDGKIVATGSTQSGAPDFFDRFALARYNVDGTLDTSFGQGGKLTTIISGKGDFGIATMIQPDGKILAGGIAGGFLTLANDNLYIVDGGEPSGSDFALVRYNSDGSLDTTFGVAGIVTTDFFGFDDGGTFAMQPDGSTVVAAGIARHAASISSAVPQPKNRKLSGAVGWISALVDKQADGDFALARYVTNAAPPKPDFSLSLAQPTINTTAGKKVTATVDITRIAGLKGTVTVKPPAAPNKTIKIPAATMSTSGTQVTFSIKVKGTAKPATYTLTFTGSDKQGQTHTADLSLTVQ
jgi:uncharacterized delta-60 repeat protein